MITTRDLSKRYGRVTALQSLDMDVPDGVIYGFIGENGAGKTTTLRLLAGLLLPDGGYAEVAGHDVVRDPRGVARVVGYMPDFFGFYDDLRVGEYLLFYAAAYGIRGAAARKLQEELLELVDLAAKRDEFVDTLSRGMQQRLCLARALVHDPQVLLLDEPASGLDPLARVELRRILKELNRMGKTIVISSHILSELADLCTHIGVISDGKMIDQRTLPEMVAGTLQEITLRCHSGLETAREVVEGRKGATINGITGGEIRFSLTGGAVEAAALLREIVLAGAAVAHYAVMEQTLEDTYVKLAGGWKQ